jgi:hypothetical protein
MDAAVAAGTSGEPIIPNRDRPAATCNVLSMSSATPEGIYVLHLLETEGDLTVSQIRQHAISQPFDLAGVARGTDELVARGLARRDGNLLRLT